MRLNRFRRGIVELGALDNLAPPGEVPSYGFKPATRLYYEERTVGATRYYAGLQARVRVDLVIRLPERPEADTFTHARLAGKLYKVVQLQYPRDVQPAAMDLSLSRAADQEDEAGGPALRDRGGLEQ